MQKRFYLTPLAVVVFILYFTVFGDRGLLRINHLHRDRDEMQKQLQVLKGENEKLRREISALQSDRRYLESIARRDFGLVRSNEVIYQFPAQGAGHADPKAPHSDPAKAGAAGTASPPAPAEPAAHATPASHGAPAVPPKKGAEQKH